MGASVSKDLLEHIKEIEGFSNVPYQDVAGVWTVGFGHTARAGEPNPKTIAYITEEEAERVLIRDLAYFISEVNKLLKVSLNSNQRDALYSFAYNIGITRFKKSTLLKKINAGEFSEVDAEMLRWIYVKKKECEGLKNRRKKEIEMWNKKERDSKGTISNTVKNNSSVIAGGAGLTAVTPIALKFLEGLNDSPIAKLVFIFGITAVIIGIAMFLIFSFYSRK